MARVIALIPARSGSKGVPHKNVRPLGGHPLIEWSIAACKAASCLDAVVVSTDSEHYAGIARDCGAEVPFLRPSELARDTSDDYDFISHAIEWFAANRDAPEFIVHIRPTTPFRDPSLIDQAVKLFAENNSFTALRSVHMMSESAYKTFEICEQGFLKGFGNANEKLDQANVGRQKFPPTFVANGYVDVLSTNFVIENRLIHGHKVKPFVTPKVTEVDDEDDFRMLEMQLQLDPLLKKRLFAMEQR